MFRERLIESGFGTKEPELIGTITAEEAVVTGTTH
jgi:hypothetical protein